jgi:uncharacterized protein
MNRIQKQAIMKDLNKKMAFIVGPRQAGKTWLAKNIAQDVEHSVYLNYDNIAHRKQILQQDWLEATDLLILDELHKMKQWKNYLKGLYDTKPAHLKIIVTGSARLDAFKQAGDSLAGRYFVHHLLPFSIAELYQLEQELDINKLITRSGFPEPYYSESETEAKRWRQEYINSLITVDVLDFEKITNLRAIRMTLDLLRHRVGSPISYKSIAEDIAISPVTVKKYIDVLEALYIVFRITPFSNNIARSILKEPKIYFFDTGLVEGDIGAKLENLIAMSLLKSCYAQKDYLAENHRLHYIRTKDKKEVDFALVKNNKIEKIIEAKNADSDIDKNLYLFSEKYDLPAIQAVKELKLEKKSGNIEVIKALNFLKNLYL